MKLVERDAAARIFIQSVRESINNQATPTALANTQAWTSAYQAARIMYLEYE